MNSYELSRNWFDWCFENPEKVTPNHTALYFFCVEHCNRLGWKQKFGLPTTMAKEAIGIRSYNTYIKTLNDLVAFGFINLIEKSKNQYSSNIIALSNFNKALDKALDKALIKHTTKQCESTSESIDSIDKQINNITIETSNNILPEKESKKSLKKQIEIPTLDEFVKYGKEHKPDVSDEAVKLKYEAWIENGWKTGKDVPIKNWKTTLLNTLTHLPTKNTQNGNTKTQSRTNDTTGGIANSALAEFLGVSHSELSRISNPSSE